MPARSLTRRQTQLGPLFTSERCAVLPRRQIAPFETLTRLRRTRPQHMDFLQRSVSSIQQCDKPVIAAVHGICFGAGLDLISACDVRLCAAQGTVFSIKVRYRARADADHRQPLLQ